MGSSLIDQRLSAPMTEEKFERQMIKKGILLPRDAAPATSARDDWKPVPIQGKPLSEVILEERR